MRYFFHLYNSEIVMDEVGEEHPDLEGANQSARKSISEFMAEQILLGEKIDPTHHIDIADAGGKVLFTRYFGDYILRREA